MKLLFPDLPLEVTGGSSVPGSPVPPISHPSPAPTPAPVVKSEREIALEGENERLKKAVKKTAEQKRKVEIKNAELTDENNRLKTPPTPQPTPTPEKQPEFKRTWMGFGG